MIAIRRSAKVGAITAVLFGTAVGGFWLGSSGGTPAPDLMERGPLAQPTIPVMHYEDSIASATEAISVTLARFPDGHNTNNATARLITIGTLLDYFFAGEVEDESVERSSPVWLVGVLGDSLTVSDVIDVPGVGTGVITDTPTAVGMYYVWDANSGEAVANGALREIGPRTYTNLVSLQDEPLVITSATMPPPSIVTPTP